MGAALFCGHSDNLFSTPLYNSGARGGLTLGRFVRPSVRRRLRLLIGPGPWREGSGCFHRAKKERVGCKSVVEWSGVEGGNHGAVIMSGVSAVQSNIWRGRRDGRVRGREGGREATQGLAYFLRRRSRPVGIPRPNESVLLRPFVIGRPADCGSGIGNGRHRCQTSKRTKERRSGACPCVRPAPRQVACNVSQ